MIIISHAPAKNKTNRTGFSAFRQKKRRFIRLKKPNADHLSIHVSSPATRAIWSKIKRRKLIHFVPKSPGFQENKKPVSYCRSGKCTSAVSILIRQCGRSTEKHFTGTFGAATSNTSEQLYPSLTRSLFLVRQSRQ